MRGVAFGIDGVLVGTDLSQARPDPEMKVFRDAAGTTRVVRPWAKTLLQTSWNGFEAVCLIDDAPPAVLESIVQQAEFDDVITAVFSEQDLLEGRILDFSESLLIDCLPWNHETAVKKLRLMGVFNSTGDPCLPLPMFTDTYRQLAWEAMMTLPRFQGDPEDQSLMEMIVILHVMECLRNDDDESRGVLDSMNMESLGLDPEEVGTLADSLDALKGPRP